MTDQLAACPFCGNKPPKDLIDTLYPTGIVWREIPEEDGLRSYHSWKDRQEGDHDCYRMGCDVSNGGCGAVMHADSREEVIAAWNCRVLAIPEGHVVVPGWQPIETAPQNKACLIHYRNICNRDRVIKAQYVSAHTIEADEDWPDEACDMDDETETAYIPAGWYEMIDNHDDCSLIGVSSGVKITGWMPLPAAPANKEG